MTTPAEPPVHRQPSTPEDAPPQGLPPDVSLSGPDSHLRDPGEFIAAVPAMLGFVPARSLVITVLRAASGESGRAAIDVVARMDLDSPGRVATGELVDRVASVCARGEAVAVLALIVDDRATAPADRHRGVRSRRHRDVIAALEHRLDADAIPLAGAWAVRAIGAELSWWSLLGPLRGGCQPDPATSMVTLNQVLEGRPMRASRTELVDSIAVNAIVRDKMPTLLESATEAAADRLAQAARRGEPNFYSRAALRQVLARIADIESGALPNVAELAEVAVALRDPSVRDILFGLMPGAHARAAETLWLELTRALPDPDRAEAAMLLGYAAYARGDGPLAGVALEAALTSDESHRMANLLDIGLQTGMPPERLRRLAEAGREAAADLGVDLRSEHP
ncbi:DUF4192 domain-containing protein [Nocardia sp. NPDC058058]|uniref:DUF4192 domain-containing protein n=1 Tax=Nocardia sp. NPDC058058 TaxID=3346317 RepID=UPI0036D9ACC8